MLDLLASEFLGDFIFAVDCFLQNTIRINVNIKLPAFM